MVVKYDNEFWTKQKLIIVFLFEFSNILLLGSTDFHGLETMIFVYALSGYSIFIFAILAFENIQKLENNEF